MLDFELMKYCYGCGACVNACPRSAIQMVQTMDGSCIPKIDQAQCINCGKCDQVCIHQHTDRYHSIIAGEGCYAAYELDKVERKESASGGMFFVLAKEVLRQDGYVCGCVWNEKMDAVHIVSNKTIDIERMRNSKYVQSDIGRCLAEIRELLKTGKTVMFCGTPCQCAACQAVTGNPENLLKVSLICEGTPTPGVWKRYRDAKAKEYGVWRKNKCRKFPQQGSSRLVTSVLCYRNRIWEKTEGIKLQGKPLCFGYASGIDMSSELLSLRIQRR